MLTVKTALLVLSSLLLIACSAASMLAQATQISVSTPTVAGVSSTPIPATATFAPTATTALPATETASPAPIVATVPTATVPPLTATVASVINVYSVTMEAMMGAEGALMNIGQYFNPVGTPVQNWHGVPVMPQATAGQEFSPIIYSYTAAATLEQAHQFYQSQAASLGFPNPPATGYSGSGNRASHNIDYVSHNLVIVLTSFDNDTSHVIVVISKIQ